MAFNGNRASQLYIAFLFALYHTCSINIFSFTQLPVNFSDVFHVQNAINMVTIPWFKKSNLSSTPLAETGHNPLVCNVFFDWFLEIKKGLILKTI